MNNGVEAVRKENPVREKSIKFAVRIVRLHQNLVAEKKELVVSRQVLRSGASIGANIEEANAAVPRAEFSRKMSISHKEAKETDYWIRLLTATDYITSELVRFPVGGLRRALHLLFSILKTTRVGFKSIQTQ